MIEWQPIDTAPEGKRVLLTVKGTGLIWSGEDDRDHPTHWAEITGENWGDD